MTGPSSGNSEIWKKKFNFEIQAALAIGSRVCSFGYLRFCFHIQNFIFADFSLDFWRIASKNLIFASFFY